jgi:serine/threonine protein kinase
MNQANTPLPEGHWLGKYRIARRIASGGLSFVYLAHHLEHGAVALKEYLPARLALRTHEGPTAAAGAADLGAFRGGMKCFLEEARALARLRHPNVVHVLDFLRANGTAYMAMRLERGETLQERIGAGAPPAEAWIRAVFAALLNGLREVHARGFLHLDIKPGNIFLRAGEVPVLIDFGAARRTPSEDGLRLLPTFTPGFCAPEHEADGARGPWSDIFSVGACIRACIAERHRRYSAALLDIVDWCLRPDPQYRPPSVLALQKALSGAAA